MRKGFTLLEVIVAITLITIGISASLLLITRTIGQMALSENQLIASYLSQEGIEIVRNIRDTNWLEKATNPNNPWDEGLTGCTTGCEADYTYTATTDPSLPSFADNFLKIDGSGFYNYTTGTNTLFKRKITIVPGDLNGDGINDTLTVRVETTWTEKGKTQTHRAQEILYNWK